jgi:hypothetical protein
MWIKFPQSSVIPRGVKMLRDRGAVAFRLLRLLHDHCIVQDRRSVGCCLVITNYVVVASISRNPSFGRLSAAVPIRAPLTFKSSSPFQVSLRSGTFGCTTLEQILVPCGCESGHQRKGRSVVRVSGVHDAGTAFQVGHSFERGRQVCSICQGSSTDPPDSD